MIDNNTAYDAANVYTSFQGLDALQYDAKAHPELAKKEVSQQFESLLVQMLLKSMRDTNKEFTSDLMHSDQSALYEDLYDKQLALVLSKSGMGIAKSIEDYIDRNQFQSVQPSDEIPPAPQPPALLTQPLKLESQAASPIVAAATPFDNTNDFIKNLWDSAKEAAHLIGVDPKLLLAQAALETNWGKNIVSHEGGGSTHNLFNIKADSSWHDKSASLDTIEQRDNVLVKEKSKFRSYDSYLDSFIDYADFLKQNNRYTEALSNASDPTKFARSLQDANYATDTLYSEKIIGIYSSSKFNHAFEQLNLT